MGMLFPAELIHTFRARPKTAVFEHSLYRVRIRDGYLVTGRLAVQTAPFRLTFDVVYDPSSFVSDKQSEPPPLQP